MKTEKLSKIEIPRCGKDSEISEFSRDTNKILVMM